MPTTLHRAVSFRAQAESTIRTESWMGRDWLVVPVIALVQGVVHGMNAEQPELALASEFGKVPQGWNGRPIVMNHPIINGEPVSANSPEALEQYQFGMLFNTEVTDDGKLRTEAWIDIARAAELGGEFQSTVDRINDGTIVEVSTGLFTDTEPGKGRYNGRDYGATWRNVVPDHLAFLSEGTIGACSVEDGCGTPRSNSTTQTPTLKVHTSAIKWQACGCPHTTPQTGDNNMPKDNNKLQTQTQTSDTPDVPEFVPEFDIVRLSANSMPDSMLDTDARKLVAEALQTANNGRYAWIIGLTKDKVVYETYDYSTDVFGTYQRSFDIAANNAVTLGDDVQKVNVTMTVTPVDVTTTPKANASGEPAMPEKNAQQQSNPAATPQTNESNTQTAETPPVTPEATPTQSEATPASTSTTATAPANNSATQQPQPQPQAQPQAPRVQTAAEFIAAAPPELQGVLQEGLRLHNEKRNGIIQALKSTNRSKFTDEQYAGMSLETLESLAALAAVPVYQGQNPGPREITDNAGMAPPPPKLIPEKQSA